MFFNNKKVDRYNKLLDIILKSINTLVKAIKGEIMISNRPRVCSIRFYPEKYPFTGPQTLIPL